MATAKRDALLPKSLRALSAALFITDLTPMAKGNQNQVFSGSLKGEPCILKVTDSRHRSRGELEAQLAMLGVLKSIAANVYAPLPLAEGSYIQETVIEGVPFYLVAYPYAAGKDVQTDAHSQEMGQALGELHMAMRQLPRYPFAEIGSEKALADIKRAAQAWMIPAEVYATALSPSRREEVHLLHGDFSAENLKIDGSRVHVFDFDNCIYGPPAYELANTLYMVLFDAMTCKDQDLTRYYHFRRGFLAGYTRSRRQAMAEAEIDAFITYRVLLLASWLHRPDDAPLFIRQASPVWLKTLNTFVKSYFEGSPRSPADSSD